MKNQVKRKRPNDSEIVKKCGLSNLLTLSPVVRKDSTCDKGIPFSLGLSRNVTRRPSYSTKSDPTLTGTWLGLVHLTERLQRAE